MELPSRENILETFDQLVSEDTVVYSPYTVIEQDCEGYPLEFRICPLFAKKPNTVGAKLDSTFDTSRKWGPGSDLYCPDERMKIATLNGTHDLALNMFCADRPQFLVLTLDSYRRQHEPLEEEDFRATLTFLRSFDDMYVLYNCGQASGNSRLHKHMQGLRGPPPAFECFTDDEKKSTIPFQHFSHHFVEGFNGTSASRLLEVYSTLLSQTKNSLGLLQTDKVCAHGLILWKDWMIVIPRRTAAIPGTKASAATGGMIGSVWLHDETIVDEWMRLGCRYVLRELGVPP